MYLKIQRASPSPFNLACAETSFSLIIINKNQIGFSSILNINILESKLKKTIKAAVVTNNYFMMIANMQGNSATSNSTKITKST